MVVIPPAYGVRRAQELWYFANEAIGMLVFERPPPGPLLRRLLRMPVWLFRARAGWLLDRQVLLLTTIGRRSGLPRTTPVGYLHDPVADVYYLTAGWGGAVNWLANVCACPRVRINVRGRERGAEAASASREDALAVLTAYTERNPFARRMWSRWIGVAFDGTPESYERVRAQFPTVAVTPSARAD